MCGVTGIAIGTIGALMSGVSSYSQMQAQAKAADYQAQIYQQNAATASQNAVSEKQAGINEARRLRLQTLSNIASQKAGFAANGVDVNNGSPVDLMNTTKYYGEMDALTTLNNANSRANAYSTQSYDLLNQSKLTAMGADNYRKASFKSALGSTLTGLGQVKGSWYSMLAAK